jgi:hypothetical protein
MITNYDLSTSLVYCCRRVVRVGMGDKECLLCCGMVCRLPFWQPPLP